MLSRGIGVGQDQRDRRDGDRDRRSADAVERAAPARARDDEGGRAEGALAQTEATLTFEDGYPSLPPTEGNAKLLAEYDRASRDLGFGPVTAVSPDRAGAADVSFIRAR